MGYPPDEDLPDPASVELISGFNPYDTPGRWRVSKVDGYAWFEPAMFDAGELETFNKNNGDSDNGDNEGDE